MINYLKGKITYKNNKSLILENQGIGFKVFCSPNTLKKISQEGETKIFTYLYLREEAAELYGFLTEKELGLFETLNDISGIGPKTAMMLASLGSLEKLKEMMEMGQLPPEIKGIGKKRTQKILLELTGKIKELKIPKKGEPADETLNALISLGFPRQRAKEALAEIPEETPEEEKMKKALKFLGRG
jgi:Holliday junction DNA helicase RuvA